MKFKLKTGLKIALSALALSTWYNLTGPSKEQLEFKNKYPLPNEIKVIQTTLPYKNRKKIYTTKDPKGNIDEKIELEKIVKIEDIDFSKDFKIKTDRYELRKANDWLPSRLIGHVLSTPLKVIFWDFDIGGGLDEERTKSVLSMLEQNKDIKGLFVRVNHNEAFYDLYRIFTEKKLKERNNLVARTILGSLICLKDEIWAEFFRGDYYNPISKTVVVYSNIESIPGHEIGHNQDFNRFTSDWEYTLARSLPPVMLYQEWQASKNAKKNLSSQDQWQFNRYLLPAFFTYILGGYFASKKILQRKLLKVNGDNRPVDELKESEKPEIHPIQTLRHFGTMNLELYTGLAVYNLFTKNSLPELLGYAGLIAGIFATGKISDTILKYILPYEHEKQRP